MIYTKTCLLMLLSLGFFNSSISFAQVGETLWEENFDNLDNWVIEQGNGNWGWGNGELQYYQADNIRIDAIPEEPDNNALVITAKQESGAGITDTWGNPLNYTSGRMNTKSKVSVQYGVIETRIKVPDLDLGGWPAFWLLGTTNYGWPSKGEIDMMEMGHQKAFRDLHDSHNGGQGAGNSTVNDMVGANAIFYADEALNAENPTGAASIAWDPDDDYCRPYYNLEESLHNRFLTYRTYWDETSIRFTVTDNGEEYDLYTDAFPIDSVSLEFQNPFFFIVNLAVGGALTDAQNLGETGTPVSMSMPAEMYVDYIKVMEWNGKGSVHLGPPNEMGEKVGLFTEETLVDAALIPSETSEIYVWEGTLTGGTEAPYEGESVLSWQSVGAGWFGAGIMAVQPLNVSNFENGTLNFSIKIPANVAFQIGIIDAWGNQNYVNFPANETTHGLERTGDWAQAAIPVSAIRGQYIDLRMLSYSFVILEVNGANTAFALDDIYWDGGGEVQIISSTSSIENLGFNLQNVPNPTQDFTTISYHLPTTTIVELQVFDISGKLIETLINTQQLAGQHSIKWDMSQQEAGVYLYSLKTNEGITSKKCIKL